MAFWIIVFSVCNEFLTFNDAVISKPERIIHRIVGRGTETQEEIEKRFSCAFEEINQIVNYDYFIVNEDIELCFLDSKRTVSK